MTGVGNGGLAQLPLAAATALVYTLPTYATSVAYDGAGNVFFGLANSTIVEAKPDGTTVTFSPTSSSNPNYDGLAVDGAGLLYVADSGHGAVFRFDPAIGISSQTMLGTVYSCGGLAFDAAGNLYITSYGMGIMEISPSGTLSTFYSNTSHVIVSLAFDSAGNLFGLTNGGDSINRDSILKFAAGQNTPTFVAQLSGSSAVTTAGLAIDAAGNLFFGENTGGVYELPAGSTSSQFLLGGASSNALAALAVSGSGSLAFISGNTTVTSYNRLTQNLNTAASTATAIGSTSPAQSVTVENDGNLPLTPTAITGSGAANSTGYTCATGTAVAVDATCTLGVQFAPTVHGSPQTGTVTLTGNTLSDVVSITGYVAGDPVALSYSSPPASMAQAGGNAGVVKVAIVDNGSGATTSTASVTLAVTSTGGYSQTYTANAVSGTVTFDLSGVSLTATGTYTYKATSGTLTSVTSTETVSPGPPVSLTVMPASASVYAGQTDATKVTALDSYGNTVTSDNNTIALTSTDSTATLPANFALASGAATTSVKFGQPGTFSITATDTVTPSVAGSFSGITVAILPSYTVTTLTDDNGSATAANCSNQSIAGATLDASCSLRDAITATNAVNVTGTTSAQPRIGFAPTLSGTLTLTAALKPHSEREHRRPGRGVADHCPCHDLCVRRHFSKHRQHRPEPVRRHRDSFRILKLEPRRRYHDRQLRFHTQPADSDQ